MLYILITLVKLRLSQFIMKLPKKQRKDRVNPTPQGAAQKYFTGIHTHLFIIFYLL